MSGSARIGDRTQETVDGPVYAVGIGPGNPRYLHPQAREVLDAADVIVGFETVLDCVEPSVEADVLPCTYDSEPEQLSTFADRVADGETGAAALMGDPNVSGYAFVEKVEGALDRPVDVVPGVSSVQVAASRSRTPLESSLVVTLHVRGDLVDAFDELVETAGDRHLLVLPRPYDYMPERVAHVLSDRGVDPSLDAHVHERLTFEDETVTQTTLGELATNHDDSGESPFSDLSVMVVGRSS